MNTPIHFEVIIIGGSYAGLSAAMALGRSLREILIIDSDEPCNQQATHSHNFLTQDGKTPAQIAQTAREQISHYPTISFITDKVTNSKKSGDAFEITIEYGQTFTAKKLLFTTGLRDIMPDIKGFTACWGLSVLHCPYCHGYEVKNKALGVLGNGDTGFELVKLISQWTQYLTLFTDGKSTLSEEQTAKLTAHNISVIEKEISLLGHNTGWLQAIHFMDGSRYPLKTLFARVAFQQHCQLPRKLGCGLTEQGYIQVDDFGKTTVPGVYAAGDNTSMFRSVSGAVAAGNKAGAMINKELIADAWAGFTENK